MPAIVLLVFYALLRVHQQHPKVPASPVTAAPASTPREI
jgi:hypothetical protein